MKYCIVYYVIEHWSVNGGEEEERHKVIYNITSIEYRIPE